MCTDWKNSDTANLSLGLESSRAVSMVAILHQGPVVPSKVWVLRQKEVVSDFYLDRSSGAGLKADWKVKNTFKL